MPSVTIFLFVTGWVSAKGRVPHVVLALLDTLRAHPGEVITFNHAYFKAAGFAFPQFRNVPSSVGRVP